MSAKFPRGGGAGPFLARSLILICTSGSGKKKVYGRRTKPITIARLEPFNVTITRLYVIGDVIKIEQAAR